MGINCPDCVACDDTLLPPGYKTLPFGNEAYYRKDGTLCFLRGLAHASLDGVDVSKHTKEADPDTGTVVLYHRDEKGHRHLCGDPWQRRAQGDGGHACQYVKRGVVRVFFPDNDEVVDRAQFNEAIKETARRYDEAIAIVDKRRAQNGLQPYAHTLKASGKIRRVS